MKSVAIALFAIAGLGWYAADDLRDWLVPPLARAVQTSGIPTVHEPCTLPTEHEQMVVVLYWRNGKLLHRCMFVGTRGTYSTPPKASL